jgi:transcriptional antiterminator NusG
LENPEEKLFDDKANEETSEVKPDDALQKKWYIVQTYAGFENRVKTAIENKIESANLQNKIFRVLVPEEGIIEFRNNTRVERVKRMYPGYIFVEASLDDDIWYLIKRINGVARFIGAKGEALPITEKEIQRVLRQIGVKEKTYDADYSIGESIRIISGSFRGYTGSVEFVAPEKTKLKVLISIFGRETPMEMDFDQVEKIE